MVQINTLVVSATCVALMLMLSGCDQPEVAGGPQGFPTPEVVTASPVVRELIEWDDYTGRLQAVQSVEVRARVSGYLDSIHFNDGQMVNKGDLLFTIDPRPFQADLDRSNAEVERANSRLELANRELQRYETLVRRNVSTQVEYDVRESEVKRAKADLTAAKAGVERARLDVEFTTIEAPISGRIGRHLITEGNLVNGDPGQATLLTTIVSLDPIHCYFDADEREYIKYVRLSRQGTRPSSRDFATPVLMRLGDELEFERRGNMDFVDNQIDFETATMRGRAIFPNPDNILTPGLFAKVKIPGSGLHEAILLPDRAVVRDQSESLVFLVRDDNVIHRQPVVPGPYVAGLRIIREGISADDLVVIDGIQGLREGIQVGVTAGNIEVDEDRWAREVPIDGIYPAKTKEVADVPVDAESEQRGS